MLEELLCSHVSVVKHRRGNGVLDARKVFSHIWREFNDVYMELCPYEEYVCRDSGVFIIRNYLLKMIYDPKAFPDTDPVIRSVRAHLRGERIYPPYCEG
ncbi:MAG: hypothetical protein GXO43_04220 [Crenarchaeota archaeon]|nr:hypothetical protein [Thermoproteota archaeon]